MDITKLGVVQPVEGFTVEVISPTEDYVKLMKKLFDFEKIKTFLSDKDFKFTYDAMHAVGMMMFKNE